MNPSISLGILLLFTNFIYAEEVKPLNNKQLDQLAQSWHKPPHKKPNLIGTRVKIQVTAKKITDGVVFCKIVNSDPKKGSMWSAHLTNFQRNFSMPTSGMQADKTYLIEGMIVENRIDHGAFWVHVNAYGDVKKDAVK